MRHCGRIPQYEWIAGIECTFENVSRVHNAGWASVAHNCPFSKICLLLKVPYIVTTELILDNISYYCVCIYLCAKIHHPLEGDAGRARVAHCWLFSITGKKTVHSLLNITCNLTHVQCFMYAQCTEYIGDWVDVWEYFPSGWCRRSVRRTRLSASATLSSHSKWWCCRRRSRRCKTTR